ncbi:cobalamin B12-binding domain-containing protein [Streptomyces glaucescens]|uniref:cobalamin B12-binding domain-containing protein n=1 Tax=Streptomyces glaucescens TaxID=1907 RepID=UPI00344E8F3F
MTDPRTSAAELRDHLWRAVTEGSEPAAVDVVTAAADAGWDEEGLLLDVVAAVQVKVGAEWAANRITVAREHAATAVNDRVVAALVHRSAARRPRDAAPRGRVTVSCVDGEWHAFPARLVTEVLRLRGWHVDYLGAQTPTPHLVAHLHDTDPGAVLLSGSLPTHLPAAHAAITACQAVGVPVLAGGRAFGPDGRFARALGADRWAADARGAAAVLEGGLPRPLPTAVRQTVDDLPHLADQEYTMAVRSRGSLVRRTMTDLEHRFPALRGYSDEQREHTAEDIAHIVDFLATALYVDDPEVFTSFLTWTAEILAARRVPADSLRTALDILAGQSRDAPRTLGMLRAGAAALRDHPADPPAQELAAHA